MRIAIDTGGTFTDCVAFVDGRPVVYKLPSTPEDPGRAVLAGVAALAGADALAAETMNVLHGTTVGTNAMLERKGARVAFVTTAGFEDTIAIGRQTRPALYSFTSPPAFCIAPAELRFGVPERVSAEGIILRRPTDAELDMLVAAIRASGAESIALSLLFAFLNPENEQRTEAALRVLNLPISTGHRIHPEFREYERASTLAVNAYLAPKMEGYLLQLERSVGALPGSGEVQVMQSSGGIISARLGAQEPVRTVLSGPAGGVNGAWRMAHAAGLERILGFDMGGTSTDVFLADAASGGPSLTSESFVAGVPLSIPMLDIHAAGAGGGSLARFDAGGMLRVGPESAGAKPGPICFGRGSAATVTDANLLLGRLDAEGFLGGSVALDRDRTQRLFDLLKGPLATAEAFAAGILRLVEAEMERAIRIISVARGHDPRRFTLVAFGGGGPLHACAIARGLNIAQVMIPQMPGALSALGILLADSVRDYALTVMLPQESMAGIAGAFVPLQQRAIVEGDAGEAVFESSLDLRYRGQGYEINVPHTADSLEVFHRLHQQRFGFADRARPIEIVNLRLRARIMGEPYQPAHTPHRAGDGAAALRGHRQVFFGDDWTATSLYDRAMLTPGDRIVGPALISEYTSVTVLPPGAILKVDSLYNLMIDVAPETA